MREYPLSNLERAFILDALSENKRLDGRTLSERRPLSLHFGAEEGTALVTLGGCSGSTSEVTLVYAVVSAFITEPALSRPNEGVLNIHVNFAPTAAPRFTEGAGAGEETVEVSRLLERCIKESRCLDLESLCVVAEEKVWCVRCDVGVLSAAGGGVAEAASVAALAALAHFKRPEVTLQGDQVTVSVSIKKTKTYITDL